MLSHPATVDYGRARLWLSLFCARRLTTFARLIMANVFSAPATVNYQRARCWLALICTRLLTIICAPDDYYRLFVLSIEGVDRMPFFNSKSGILF